MLIVLSTAVAMVLWVLAWALGVKGFDAFMLGLVVVLLASTAQVIIPYLPGNRKGSDDAPDPAPFT
jgi:hypothetical protein